MAPSASHVAVRASTSQVEQLDLFALLAPRIACLGALIPKQRVETRTTQQAVTAWPFLMAQPLAVEPVHFGTEADALTASVFDAYRPGVQIPGACPHPTRLVESAAMAAATAPPSDYQPTLPEHLVTRGALSEAQLETVCRAGSAHLGHLPGGGRGARPAPGLFHRRRDRGG